MGVRGELFSTKVALQNRTYFFNVKENRMGDIYLNIVESKNRDEGGFDRQSVILFADDLHSFLGGFDESLRALEKAAREKRRGTPGKGERTVPSYKRPDEEISRKRPDADPGRRRSEGSYDPNRKRAEGSYDPSRKRTDRTYGPPGKTNFSRRGAKNPRADAAARPREDRTRDTKGRGDFVPRKKRVVVRKK